MNDTAIANPIIACPKCGADLVEKAIACAKCGAQVAQAKPDKIELTLGQKIAAGTLILNGIVLVLEMVLSKDPTAAQSARGAIASIIIGAYLFTGKPSALKWAKIAVIIGAVLYTGINIAQGDIFSAVFQVLFSLSLVGLLFGRAGTVRLVFCCLFILGYFGLETVGLIMMKTGMLDQPDTTQTQSKP